MGHSPAAYSLLPAPLLIPVAFYLLLVAPGLWLLAATRHAADWPALERWPLAFCIGLLLSAPPLWLALLARTSLTGYTVLWLLWLAAVYVLTHLPRRVALGESPTRPYRVRPHIVLPSDRYGWLELAVVGALAVGVYAAVRFGPRDSDSLTYTAHIQERLVQAHLAPSDPLLGLDALPVQPRLWLNPWLMAQSGLILLTRADPLAAVFHDLPPLLALLSLAATYGLARTLFGRRDLALLALLAQVVLYAATLGSHDGLGFGFFARAVEDKMLLWLVVLPVAARLGLRWLAKGTRWDGVGYAACMGVGILLHPLGLALGGLFAAGMAAVRVLFRRRPADLGRLAWLFVVFIVLLPYVWFERGGEEYVPFGVTGDDALVTTRLDLSAGRLVILDGGRYVADTALLDFRIVGLALLLAITLLPRLRSSLTAQYLLGVTLLPLLLIYNPITAPLVGRFTSPWLLWRITWAAPLGMLLAAGLLSLWEGTRLLVPGRLREGGVWAALALATLLALSRGDVQASVAVWQRGNTWLPPADVAFIRAAAPYLPADRPVLAPPQLNRIIPARLPTARVVEFRGTPQFPARRRDVDAFFDGAPPDADDLATLARYDVAAVVAPTGSPLAAALAGFPALLPPLLHDETWSLYGVALQGDATPRATVRAVLWELTTWLDDAEAARQLAADGLRLPLDGATLAWAAGDRARLRGDWDAARAFYQTAGVATDALDWVAALLARADTVQAARDAWQRVDVLAAQGGLMEARMTLPLAAQLTGAARAALLAAWDAAGDANARHAAEQALLDFEIQIDGYATALP